MKMATILLAVFIFLIAATPGYAQTIVVTNPGAGMILYHGETCAIAWTVSGDMDHRVKVRLWRTVAGVSEKVLDIIDLTANDGSYDWPVPATVAPGPDILSACAPWTMR